MRVGASLAGVHTRTGVHTRAGVEIREAVGRKPTHSPNTCGHMDLDGNRADKDIPRTRSARARREAKRSNSQCART
jgi:hypothetical protein